MRGVYDFTRAKTDMTQEGSFPWTGLLCVGPGGDNVSLSPGGRDMPIEMSQGSLEDDGVRRRALYLSATCGYPVLCYLKPSALCGTVDRKASFCKNSPARLASAVL